jgi:hypothetical protein
MKSGCDHVRGGSLLLTLACVALAACAPPAAEQDSVTDIAPGRGELRPVARIGHERIGECSGIIHHDGAFWVHNDSGDDPILYRSLDLSFDEVEVLPVPGATAVDWEEIAVYGGDLLVCDMGDNRRERDDLTLYRVRYLPAGGDGGRVELVASYPFRYPDGAHDAEACFTIDGRVHIVNKDRGEGTTVYRFAELHDASALAPGESNVPVIAGMLSLETREMITGGTYDPGSETVVLLTYSAILTYPKDRLSGPPERVTRIWARQCEAICLCGDKLVFANEERDVFIVNDFLRRGYTELLPPRGSVILTAKSLDISPDGTGSGWIDQAARIPLRDGGPGEALHWLLLNESRILIHGRLDFEGDLRPTKPDSSRLGSTVLLMFAPEARQFISEEETHLAIGMDPSGRFAVWKLDLLGYALDFESVDAAVTARTDARVLEFEVALPVGLIFDGPVPERFRFDIRGLRLRGERDVYFSGPGLYSVERPYVWGDVFVQR